MASTRFTHRLLRVGREGTRASRCQLHSQASRQVPQWHAMALGGLGMSAGLYGAYKLYRHNQGTSLENEVSSSLGVVHAAAKFPESQPSVFSQTKDHAVYLWIHLKPGADAKACAKVTGRLHALVDKVCPPDLRDENDEIWAGVGFGPSFFSKIGGKVRKNYAYPDRKGALGPLPSTGGDIFFHAKSNEVSKLFELCQAILAEMPKGSVDKFEDIYSFVYRNGRDLSGFIDGTENRADDEERQQVAVEKETGGSYVVAQKWVHKMDVIGREKDDVMSGWVGRAREDSTELKSKAITSHVARMTGGSNFEQKKQFEIVRQSMPYGNLHDQAGLFFIGYSASPENLEYMLKRMVGEDKDKHSDDIMRLTECVKGTYWYFPGVEELKKLTA